MPSFVFYVAFFVAFSLFLYLLQPISHSKRKDFATVAFTLRIYAQIKEYLPYEERNRYNKVQRTATEVD